MEEQAHQLTIWKLWQRGRKISVIMQLGVVKQQWSSHLLLAGTTQMRTHLTPAWWRVSPLDDTSEVTTLHQRRSADHPLQNPAEHWAFLNLLRREVPTPQSHFPDDYKASHGTLCNSGSTTLVRKCCWFSCCLSNMLPLFVLSQESPPQFVGSLKKF